MLKKVAILCMTAALSAALVCAQGPGPRGMGGPPPDPDTMIKMRVDFLATQLTLTDAQKAKATAIFADAYTASQTLQSSLQTTRQSLPAAVKKNDTAAIDQLAATVGSLTGQLTAIQSKAEAAFYAILTTDQQAKYDQMPHGGPGGGSGPMGPGGFGPQRRGAQRQ